MWILIFPFFLFSLKSFFPEFFSQKGPLLLCFCASFFFFFFFFFFCKILRFIFPKRGTVAVLLCFLLFFFFFSPKEATVAVLLCFLPFLRLKVSQKASCCCASVLPYTPIYNNINNNIIYIIYRERRREERKHRSTATVPSFGRKKYRNFN